MSMVCNWISKRGFVFALLGLYILLQLWLINELALFGDEAFYWLEGQHLAWSYAELPAWTAWMTRLGTQWLGPHYFAVRLVSYAAFLCSFYALFLIHRQFQSSHWPMASLLLVSMPLLALVAILALPDVWMICLVMWVSYCVILAHKYNRWIHWLWLGALLAIGINVHVRMWIWIGIAAMVFMVINVDRIKHMKGLWLISLPLSLVGFIPVFIFNGQHDFVLFNFQFGQRHPWQFQWANIGFVLSQLLVISPLVLWVWGLSCYRLLSSNRHRVLRWMAWTSILHWLFYVITSLFADGLRTSVHWVLVSYVPILAIAHLVLKKQALLCWAVISGLLMSMMMLLLIANGAARSAMIDRIMDNAVGWPELAEAVDEAQKQHNTKAIVADYFMTAAQLRFELGDDEKIWVLGHEKNFKHGRQQQLAIMDMLLQEPQQYGTKSLLVVEDSTLKLQDKGRYYQQLCDDFGTLNHVKTISIHRSKKQFHLFVVNEGHANVEDCQIPPLFYVEPQPTEIGHDIIGWVVLHKTGIRKVELIGDDHGILPVTYGLKNRGIAQQFPEIMDPQAPNNGFFVRIEKGQISSGHFRLKAIGHDGSHHESQLFYLP